MNMNTRELTEDSSYLIGKYLNCESPHANEILDPIFGLQETYRFSKRQRNIFYLNYILLWKHSGLQLNVHQN